VSRSRITDTDRTLRRHIDIAAAFEAAEPPSRPAVRELVPLDAVPVLACGRSEVPWEDLSTLGRQLLLRVDGRARAMSIVTGNARTPRACASELAALARRGLLRLRSTASDDVALPLEIDLTTL
jgi:hypothetical protein